MTTVHGVRALKKPKPALRRVLHIEAFEAAVVKSQAKDGRGDFIQERCHSSELEAYGAAIMDDRTNYACARATE